MKIYEGGDQLTLPDLDMGYGKMCRAPTPAVSRRARTTGLSSKNLSALQRAEYMCLDLRPGFGNLLGPYWEINALWLGEPMTHKNVELHISELMES